MKVYGYEVFENAKGSITIKQKSPYYEGKEVWVIFTPEQIDRLCEDLQKVKKETMSEEQ